MDLSKLFNLLYSAGSEWLGHSGFSFPELYNSSDSTITASKMRKD